MAFSHQREFTSAFVAGRGTLLVLLLLLLIAKPYATCLLRLFSMIAATAIIHGTVATAVLHDIAAAVCSP
jgi:hypothetical protein